MKKISLLFALLMCGCSTNIAKVQEYVMAYQTSEVQEYTHDVRLAHINDFYVEVDEKCNYKHIAIKKTDNIIYYHVYGIEEKVSNKGWVKA